MNGIVFSFVMAAYNSEKTIEKSLISIRKQDFRQDRIEIIVVDGISSDRTRSIAQKYNCIILDNKKRLPEIAKTIGLKAASGDYLCIMDSDEALARNTILSERYSVLVKHHEIKCMSIGLKTPFGSKPCSYYINSVGDPFSCFIYKTYDSGVDGLIIHGSLYDKENQCYIKHYDANSIKPIGDSGTVMDLGYIKDNYKDKLDFTITATLYDDIISDTGLTAYIKGDDNTHYSDVSLKTFLGKLKFRIINNIFAVEGSGYSSKAQGNKKLNARKYLFPLYTISIVIPLIDGIRMAVNYKHWVFLFHPLFCLYVLLTIAIMYLEKLVGIKKENKSYAK